MAGDYAALLEHLDARDAVLVGHSMGGFLSLVFVQVHAEVAEARLGGVLLVGAHGGRVAKGAPQTRAQVKLIQWGVMSRIARAPRLGRAMNRTLFGRHADPRDVEENRRGLVEHDMKRSLPILKAQLDEDWAHDLAAVSVPIRLLCGERDRTCPPRHSQRIAKALGGAPLRLLPGIGHLVNYEAPDSIVEEVAALRG